MSVVKSGGLGCFRRNNTGFRVFRYSWGSSCAVLDTKGGVPIMRANRREFIKVAGAALVAPQISVQANANSGAGEAKAVLVDLPGCVGCRKCEFACQQAAGFEVPPIETFDDKSPFENHRRPEPAAWTVVNQYATPNSSQENIYAKVNCLHCVDPACASACLVGALEKRPEGPVIYDASKCMGCRYCMIACPFQVPTYEYGNALTPQVRKCTFCADRLDDNGGVPACVGICPRECLTYGKRSDLLTIAHDRIREQPEKYVDHVYGEFEAGGTSWLYLSNLPFEELDFVKMGTTAPHALTEAIQHGVFKFFVPPLALYALLGLIMHMTNNGTPEGSDSPRVRSVPQPAVSGQRVTCQPRQEEERVVV